LQEKHWSSAKENASQLFNWLAWVYQELIAVQN